MGIVPNEFVIDLLPYLGTFLSLWVRACAFLFALPFFFERRFLIKERVAFALFFAAAATPARGLTSVENLVWLVPLEALLGLACGFAVRLVLAGIEVAGELWGIQLGLGFAGSFDPSWNEVRLPTQKVMHALFGLWFFSSDALPKLMTLLATPALGEASPQKMAQAALRQGGKVLSLGLSLAAPVVLATMVTQIAVALSSRASPSFNLFSVFFVAVLLAGGWVLVITAPGIMVEVGRLARQTPEWAAELVWGR